MDDPLKIPQPDELTNREKDDAMGAYLMMFATWAVGLPLPAINLIAAFIYYVLNKKSSRFVAFHCLQSLLSQIPVTVLNAGLLAWVITNLVRDSGFDTVFFVYLAFTVVSNVLYIVYSFVALARAFKGRFYYMPLFGKKAFARFYGPHARALVPPTPPNEPPPGT